MEIYVLKRQRTAGAYLPVKSFESHNDAVLELTKIASETPEYPYDGGDTYKVGNSSHHTTRYKIVKEVISPEGKM